MGVPSAPDANNQAVNALYSSLSGGDSSGWGENLATAKHSIGTVEKRLLQVAKAAREIKNFKFGSAAKTLGLKGVPGGLKQNAKAFGNNFLEYHFGWEPAIGDIHNSLKTLTQTDFGGRKVRGFGTQNFTYHWTEGSTVYNASWTMRSRCGANARIVNESSYLANQLGVLNPLAVAWELVPFSFVVDWFTNIGDVIGGLTGLVGVEVDNTYTTTSGEGYYTETSRVYLDEKAGYAVTTQSMKNFIVERKGGLPTVQLEIRPFKGFSPTRGLTAASLLLQALK
jgi:hypothetical protein